MILSILLATLNGVLFLSVLVGVTCGRLTIGSGIPAKAWLGGVLGVVFVALNSLVVARLGASKATGLVVGAQMLASVAIDSFGALLSGATVVALGGAALIVLGVRLSVRRAPETQPGPGDIR
jgi:transporter family-2 protein